MAALTNAELLALNFGYLTGADLTVFAPFTLLIAQYAKDPNCLQYACNAAQAEVTGNANTTYDIATEYSQTGTARSQLCVQITAVLACRYALGNLVGDGDALDRWFKWGDKQVLALRNGQLNLPLKITPVQASGYTPYSGSCLVRSGFSTLG